MKYRHVVCGGTFDHLHIGHKKLLEACLQSGERVTVGITTKATVRHKAYIVSLESYSKRAENVRLFNSSVIIYKLTDMYGPTLTDMSIDAICVTEDTLSGATKINKKRLQLGMKPLSIISIPMVYDNNNEKISSERIRKGVIDREGRNYYKYLISNEKLILPDSLRSVLRKPMGRIFSSFSRLSSHQIARMRDTISRHGSIYLCTVGDMVTLGLKKMDTNPIISIVDGKTQRKALNNDLMKSILEIERYDAVNEKGTIQKEAVEAIYTLFDIGHIKAIKQLYINGEEDLLTLVVVLLAPLSAHIWYGQQGIGAVDVRVTEKKKENVYNLLRQFDNK